MAFLRNYVKKSEQEFPVLVPLEETGMDGTKETEWRRTVTSAHTLLNVWRSLIAQADSTVLLKKRREDPANKHTWRLKFMDHTNRQGQGPVYEISKVSQTNHPPRPPQTTYHYQSPSPLRDEMSGTPSLVLLRLNSHLTLPLRIRTSPFFVHTHSRPLFADHLTTNSGFSKRALLNSGSASTCSLRR